MADIPIRNVKYSQRVTIDKMSEHLREGAAPFAYTFIWPGAPDFTLSPTEKCNFNLEVYPKGAHDFLSVYLHFAAYPTTLQPTKRNIFLPKPGTPKKDWSSQTTIFEPRVQPQDKEKEKKVQTEEPKNVSNLKIRINLSIINSLGDKCWQKVFRGKINHSKYYDPMSRGFPQYIHQKHLQDPTNGFLPNDTLTFFCEVEINNEAAPFTVNQAVNEEMKYEAIGKPLKLQKIETTETEPAGKSEYVVIMFSPRKESLPITFPRKSLENYPALVSLFAGTEKITLKDDYHAFVQMLHFIEGNKIENIDGLAENLLILSIKYRIANLQQKCETTICQNINENNIWRVLQLSFDKNLEQIKQSAIEFINKNRWIKGENSFKEFTNQRADILSDSRVKFALTGVASNMKHL